jgi:hypothetical protein
MDRRKFLATSLASAAAAPLGYALQSQQAPGPGARQYYELRRYQLLTPQRKLADDYFRGALVPGLNRLGISPVGVFNVSIGPEGPSIYVLLPSTSVETLVTSDAHLGQDPEYVKAASDFLNAPAKSPAFVRMESSLMQALAGAPRLTVPEATAQHLPRLFELRTYESSTDQDHQAKVAQVNEGRILARLFRRHGDRRTNAEPDLHDRFCEPRRTGQGLGRIPVCSGDEGPVRPAEIHIRGSGVERRQCRSDAGGLFSDLRPALLEETEIPAREFGLPMPALTRFSDSAMFLTRLASERNLDASRSSQQRSLQR